MALVVEDGTGLPTANSYVSLAEVAAYHADRNHPAWGSASTASQTAAAIAATRYLDTTYPYENGLRLSKDQGLLWPRKVAYDMEGFSLPAIPPALKWAACELALVALTEELLPAQDRETAQEAVGPLSVVYKPGAAPRREYPFVRRLLERYGLVSASNSRRILRA